MDKLYRINYVVDMKGISCTIYTYPILGEKNSYYIIRSGRNNRHIKKKDIGEIRDIDVDRTGFYVFLTELENKNKFVAQMVEKVKKNASLKVKKFQSIYDNAVLCDAKIIDVEPE